MLVEEHGVLSEPAQSCPPSKVSFQKRGRIHDSSPLAAGNFTPYPRQELMQLSPEDEVIILSSSVAGYFSVGGGERARGRGGDLQGVATGIVLFPASLLAPSPPRPLAPSFCT